MVTKSAHAIHKNLFEADSNLAMFFSSSNYIIAEAHNF